MSNIKTTDKVAEGLESAGSYIEERKFRDLPRDLINANQETSRAGPLIVRRLGTLFGSETQRVARATLALQFLPGRHGFKTRPRNFYA